MDRDHLTRLIDAPTAVRKDDLVDLRAMSERYPWFSGAHLLMAVGGHREGDVLFDEQLMASAAHLPSRAVLYDLVHGAAPRKASIPPPPPEPNIAALEPAPIEAAPLTVVRDPEPVAVELIEMAAAATEIPVETPEPTPPVAVVVTEPVTAAPALAQETSPEEDNLDLEIRNAAVAVSYELLLEEAALPAVAPAARTVPETTSRTPGPRRFTDWLESSAPVAAPVPAQHSATQATTPAPKAAAPIELDTKALIERFIQQSVPPAPTKKAEFFTPQQAGKRSLEDHADLVSETLAKIYEKQGNIAKAIAMYERLALKYPAKSGHYRAQAKALGAR